MRSHDDPAPTAPEPPAPLPIWIETRWGIAILAIAAAFASIMLLFSLMSFFSLG